MDRIRATLAYIYRQANQSADHLARLEAEQEEDFTKDSPQSIHRFVIEDALGIGQYNCIGISPVLIYLCLLCMPLV